MEYKNQRHKHKRTRKHTYLFISSIFLVSVLLCGSLFLWNIRKETGAKDVQSKTSPNLLESQIQNEPAPQSKDLIGNDTQQNSADPLQYADAKKAAANLEQTNKAEADIKKLDKEKIDKEKLDKEKLDKEKLDKEKAKIQEAHTDQDTPWNLILVNKDNPIPENNERKLVDVNGNQQVDERIYEPLMDMLEAAREGNGGELPIVVSGYRTQEKQQSLFDEKINQFKNDGYSEAEALEQTKKWVAVPGYSEHQVGLAVDINGAIYDVYLWLQENSYKYGFIFRYPGDKTDITGTEQEVWHYRYVGKEAAAEMYQQGLCLEEYLEKRQSKNLS